MNRSTATLEVHRNLDLGTAPATGLRPDASAADVGPGRERRIRRESGWQEPSRSRRAGREAGHEPVAVSPHGCVTCSCPACRAPPTATGRVCPLGGARASVLVLRCGASRADAGGVVSREW